MCLPEVPSYAAALSTMVLIHLFFESLIFTLVAGAIAFATSVLYNAYMDVLLLEMYHQYLHEYHVAHPELLSEEQNRTP